MKTVIVDSLVDYNVFFIFRDNGTQIRCFFHNRNWIKHDRHKLTSDEIRDIKSYYKAFNSTLFVNKTTK